MAVKFPSKPASTLVRLHVLIEVTEGEQQFKNKTGKIIQGKKPIDLPSIKLRKK